jgi:hypothetical protein
MECMITDGCVKLITLVAYHHYITLNQGLKKRKRKGKRKKKKDKRERYPNEI